MKYAPLKCHSDYSLLKSTCTPEQISVRLKEIGSGVCAITDYDSLSGVPPFLKGLKDGCKHCGYKQERHEDGKGKCVLKDVVCPGFEKNDVKGILGLKFSLSQLDASIKDTTNLDTSYIHLLAKNKSGWKNLIKGFSEANGEEFFYKKPRLDFERLIKYSKDLIAYTGDARSELANLCFTNLDVYNSKSYDEAKSFVKDQSNLRKDLLSAADKYKQVFKENLFLAIETVDASTFPANKVLTNIFRWLGKELDIKCVGVPAPHYTNKAYASDQRVLLCSSLDCSLQEADEKSIGKDLNKFYKSNSYSIPTYEELGQTGNTEQELANTILVAEMCEEYDIFGKPQLPQFECPNGKTSDEYLRELCLDGWKRKINGIIGTDLDKKKEYADRVKKELDVLKSANLPPYFLIVHDFNRYAREVLNCPRDPGRGSAAGCLVSYLLDITDCDPILYDLSFERFYNQGRNDPAKGKFAMPDIDMDYPPEARAGIELYIKNKYGRDKVCKMSTFAQLQGREALSTVFRAHKWGSFDEKKKITSFIAQKDKITDDLQEMMEETGESSIIRWSLENNDKELKPYCEILQDGTFDGPLAKLFEQAIRLEGNKKSKGIHPSGLIISPIPISDVCPMAFDPNSGEMVTSWDMYSCEPAGLLKFDILGTSVNQKIVDCCKFAKYGKIV